MKLYQVIYNSSQQGRSGNVGLDVRTVTAGTPQEAVKALRDTDSFANRSRCVGGDITSAALLQNPQEILRFKPAYCFKSIEADAKKFWALQRCQSVGFDYMFYMNGKATRLGNYVVDTLLSEDLPPKQIFDLLYEDPAPGSMYFMPRSPIPTQDNEEMKRLTLGAPADLPPVSGAVALAHEHRISNDAIEVAFAILKSTQEGNKAVLVKTPVDKQASLMADLMRLMPEKHIGLATFMTAYASEGVNRDVRLHIIGEDYQFDVFPRMWVMLDLLSGQEIDSHEARQMRAAIRDAVAKGDTARTARLMSWLFSDEYQKVKNLPDAEMMLAYRFSEEPDTLTVADFDSLYRSKALQNALAGRLNSDARLHKIFCDDLAARFNACTSPAQVKTALDLAHSLKANGISVDDAVAQAHNVLYGAVMGSAERFSQFFDLTNGAISAYPEVVAPRELPTKYGHYLSQYDSPTWKKLYRLFIPQPVDPRQFILRTFSDNLTPAVRKEVIDAEIKPEVQLPLLMELTKTMAAERGDLLSLIGNLQRSGLKPSGTTFFVFYRPLLESGQAPAQLYPVLMHEFDKAPVGDIDNYVRLMQYFASFPGLLPAVNEAKHSAVIAAAKDKMRNPEFDFRTLAPSFELLASLPGAGKHAREIGLIKDFVTWKVNAGNISGMLMLSLEIGSRKCFKALLPETVRVATLDGTQAAAAAKYAIEKGMYTPVSLMALVLEKRPQMLGQWAAAIYGADSKLKYKYFLEEMAQAGLSDEQALKALQQTNAAVYEKYLKSLNPNIFVKIANFFKGLFTKKDKPSEAPSKPRTQKKTAGRK